ncbi:MAG: hypothetical protein GXO10_04325 [Crenarchaeota archaeon]|nr:hypothetical protein [Thermoproteota archaeon]
MTNADSTNFRELCLKDNERIRKLQKFGRSLYVALPNCLKTILGLAEGSHVKLIVENINDKEKEAILRLIIVK